MKTKILSDPPSGVSSSNQQALDGTASHHLVAFRNLLVPIDFSEHSKKTIECAMQLATFTGATIKILYVFQMPEDPEAFYQGLYIESDVVKRHMETAKGKANKKLTQFTEQMRAKGLNAQPILRFGNPYEEIVSVAKEMAADLIVIGSHGYGCLASLLLGSTVERVLQCAPCAVLVVKDAHVDRLAARQTAEACQD